MPYVYEEYVIELEGEYLTLHQQWTVLIRLVSMLLFSLRDYNAFTCNDLQQ
jgi:hypothetical protein